MFTMKKPKHTLVNLSVSIPQDLRDVARQAAFDDNRSVSSLVTCALQRYLGAEGYLKSAPAKPAADRSAP